MLYVETLLTHGRGEGSQMSRLLNMALAIALLPAAADAWVAYNDLNWDFTQGPANNITTYSSTNHLGGLPSSGDLLNYDTGATLGAHITIEGGGYGTLGQMPSPGTDADTSFGGKVNAAGSIDSDVEPCTITISGLDTNLSYQFVIFGCAGIPSYGDGDASTRSTRMTIGDAASWNNHSTPAARITGPGDNATVIDNGYNVEGFVARFSDIDPGPDGDFTITCVGETANGLYINAFSLQAIPEPITFTLFGLGSLALLLRRRI